MFFKYLIIPHSPLLHRQTTLRISGRMPQILRYEAASVNDSGLPPLKTDSEQSKFGVNMAENWTQWWHFLTTKIALLRQDLTKKIFIGEDSKRFPIYGQIYLYLGLWKIQLCYSIFRNSTGFILELSCFTFFDGCCLIKVFGPKSKSWLLRDQRKVIF